MYAEYAAACFKLFCVLFLSDALMPMNIFLVLAVDQGTSGQRRVQCMMNSRLLRPTDRALSPSELPTPMLLGTNYLTGVWNSACHCERANLLFFVRPTDVYAFFAAAAAAAAADVRSILDARGEGRSGTRSPTTSSGTRERAHSVPRTGRWSSNPPC